MTIIESCRFRFRMGWMGGLVVELFGMGGFVFLLLWGLLPLLTVCILFWRDIPPTVVLDWIDFGLDSE
jgi:hypothetical protein